MNIFNLFRRQETAPLARERLQILLAHERSDRGQPDLLNVLREAILTAVTKHVAVDRQNVQVKMDRGDSVSTLVIDVEIPNTLNCLAPAINRASAPRIMQQQRGRRRARAGA